MKKFYVFLMMFSAGSTSVALAQESSESSPVSLIAQHIQSEQRQQARAISMSNTFSPSAKRERAIDTYSQESYSARETASFKDQVDGVQLLQHDGSVRSYKTNKKNWFNE